MKETIFSLLKQESSKHVYFFLTITGSIIAFFVTIILEKKVGFDNNLLLVAIILLVCSFLAGWKGIQLYMQDLRYEFALKDIEGKVKDSNMKEKIGERIYRHLDENDEKLRCCNKWQLIFFGLGMLSFILWLFLIGAYPLT